MLTLTVQPLYERGIEAIGLSQPLDKELEYTIRKIKGIRWSGTHKVWYLPLSKANFQLFSETLKGKAMLETQQLKQYLEQRKSVQNLRKGERVSKKRAQIMIQQPLSEEPQSLQPVPAPAPAQRLPFTNDQSILW